MENKENGNEKLKAFVDVLKTSIFKAIMLGYEIGKAQTQIGYNTIIEFLKGNTTSCYCFDTLKPLYDKFGYETTNEAILKLYKTYEKEQKENEQSSVNGKSS